MEAALDASAYLFRSEWAEASLGIYSVCMY
jgi:hypothetical protein